MQAWVVVAVVLAGCSAQGSSQAVGQTCSVVEDLASYLAQRVGSGEVLTGEDAESSRQQILDYHRRAAMHANQSGDGDLRRLAREAEREWVGLFSTIEEIGHVRQQQFQEWIDASNALHEACIERDAEANE